MPSGPTRPTSF